MLYFLVCNGVARTQGAYVIAEDVSLGAGVVIHHPELVNIYGCVIGDGTKIGAFVEIQRGAVIGANCKISSHTYLRWGENRGRRFRRARSDVHQRSVPARGQS